MKPALFIAIALAMLTAGSANAAPAWKNLFNGHDLSNFDIAYSSKPVDGRPASALFEVTDGMVHTYPGMAAGTAMPSAYFETRDSYGDYVLHLEYRWGDKKFAPRMARLKDAGIVYHAYRDVPDSWPLGVEAQIEDTDVGDLWLITTQVRTTTRPNPHPRQPDPLQDNAAAYDPAGQDTVVGAKGQYVRLRHSANYEKPGWNSVDVVVRGDSAVYLVNGKVNMRIKDIRRWDDAAGRWVPLTKGRILFQAEYAEVYYRDIKIRPVTAEDPR
jgi:hypothetical protein